MNVRRDIERALLGRVGADARRRLHDRLRSDAQAQALYDRGAEALRALEGGREPAEFEVDLVESWLREDGVIADVAEPVRPRWRGLWIALAVVSAAALVVVLRPRAIAPVDDALTAKGPGQGSPLAIDVLCGAAQGSAMHPATEGCAHADTLAFAYRVDDKWSGGDTLVLFGVDANGEARYYVPTPDTAAPRAAVGQWHALDRTVRLAVNHRPGRLRVFGLLTDAAPDVDAIDEAAALLSALPSASVGDLPWHERLAGTGGIANSCARSQSCASAELELWIHEDRP
jgi:hypothetical protein